MQFIVYSLNQFYYMFDCLIDLKKQLKDRIYINKQLKAHKLLIIYLIINLIKYYISII